MMDGGWRGRGKGRALWGRRFKQIWKAKPKGDLNSINISVHSYEYSTYKFYFFYSNILLDMYLI
jgi:hypothetical protein